MEKIQRNPAEDPDDDSIITIDSIPDHIWTGSEIEDFPVVRDETEFLSKM